MKIAVPRDMLVVYNESTSNIILEPDKLYAFYICKDARNFNISGDIEYYQFIGSIFSLLLNEKVDNFSFYREFTVVNYSSYAPAPCSCSVKHTRRARGQRQRRRPGGEGDHGRLLQPRQVRRRLRSPLLVLRPRELVGLRLPRLRLVRSGARPARRKFLVRAFELLRRERARKRRRRGRRLLRAR